MRRARPPAHRRVALAFPHGLVFAERLLHGIADYARSHGGWTLVHTPELWDPSPRWLRHWSGDGAIVVITTRADARIARNLPFPVVNLAAYLRDTGLPSLMVDHADTGRLAAEHLLARRFRRFGYYGARGTWFNELRREAFMRTIVAAGGECACLEADAASVEALVRHQAELERWLKRLRPPVGILASTDQRASMLLDACRHLGLRVPGDLAVVGVDNDPMICDFVQPTLTSVSRSDRRVGSAAAELLDQLMSGDNAPDQPVLIPPDGVVERRSTATLAVEHPLVAAALADIEAHLGEPFGVERILDRVPLARRRVEALFHAHVGCSPYRAIIRARVERAKHLLAAPGRTSLTTIAQACGFTDLRHFRQAFQRSAGLGPREFRRSLTGHADA
jgi:LacI family transcriptional regulator